MIQQFPPPLLYCLSAKYLQNSSYLYYFKKTHSGIANLSKV